MSYDKNIEDYASIASKINKIYCIKYEELFSNIRLINRVLEIPDVPELYPKKQERIKNYIFVKELVEIYLSLMNKMKKMRYVEIIYPLNPGTVVNFNDV